MMLVYLDASVWVKRYVIEEGSKRVQQWLKKGPVVVTSPLALIEVMTTLVRKERAGELATDDMNASLHAAEADYEWFASVPLSNGVIAGARALSRQYGLRGADTIHLAAAQWIAGRSAFRNDPTGLVTSDRELAEAAEHAGLDVFDPTREPLPAP
jgi:predicted nucleic acid-binding protein